MPYKFIESPRNICSVQLCPASVVTSSPPSSPTIQPLVGLMKAASMKSRLDPDSIRFQMGLVIILK